LEKHACKLLAVSRKLFKVGAHSCERDKRTVWGEGLCSKRVSHFDCVCAVNVQGLRFLQ